MSLCSIFMPPAITMSPGLLVGLKATQAFSHRLDRIDCRGGSRRHPGGAVLAVVCDVILTVAFCRLELKSPDNVGKKATVILHAGEVPLCRHRNRGLSEV